MSVGRRSMESKLDVQNTIVYIIARLRFAAIRHGLIND